MHASELCGGFPCFIFKGKCMELIGNSGGGRNKRGIRGEDMWGRLNENFIYMYEILNTSPPHTKNHLENPVRMFITKKTKDNKCCQGCLE